MRYERPGSAHRLLAVGDGRTRFVAMAALMTSILFLVTVLVAAGGVIAAGSDQARMALAHRRKRIKAKPPRLIAGTRYAPQILQSNHFRRQEMAGIALRGENAVARITAGVYVLLFPIPIVLFVAAAATDGTYAAGAQLMWLHFSEWLIAAGLAFGALAAIALLIEFSASRAIRAGPFGWAHLLLFYACLVVELFNAFVHTIDGWTAVVPNGITLSIVGALIALVAVGVLFRVPTSGLAEREVLP